MFLELSQGVKKVVTRYGPVSVRFVGDPHVRDGEEELVAPWGSAPVPAAACAGRFTASAESGGEMPVRVDGVRRSLPLR
jgi:hypothetical protein